MITQNPSLERLLEFEPVSWPTEEQASAEDIAKRRDAFGEGIFMLSDKGVDVAQLTLSPKNCVNVSITSFARMRDLPVDRSSDMLWGTNLAVRGGCQGKGYAVQIVTHGFTWAAAQGYSGFAGAVTCGGYADALVKSGVSSIEEYLQKGMNPALRTFAKVARLGGWRFVANPPISGYWPEDVGSAGYGVLLEIYFK